MSSICKFVLSNPSSDAVHIINFVYEVNPRMNKDLSISAAYRMCYVTNGTAAVTCGRKDVKVKKGDVFFVFPAEKFAICGDDDFRYMYISFLGTRLNAELDKFRINLDNFVFSGLENLDSIWDGILSLKTDVINLACEGVTLYTLSQIACAYERQSTEGDASVIPAKAILIKNFIDENFKNPSLSLKTIGAAFMYSNQHISKLFKEQFKIGFTEYLTTIRINYACSLIDKNYTSVTEIAYASGFEDALYFSKVFKRKIGVSPKQYINERPFGG